MAVSSLIYVCLPVEHAYMPLARGAYGEWVACSQHCSFVIGVMGEWGGRSLDVCFMTHAAFFLTIHKMVNSYQNSISIHLAIAFVLLVKVGVLLGGVAKRHMNQEGSINSP